MDAVDELDPGGPIGAAIRCDGLRQDFVTGAGEVVRAIDTLDLSITAGQRVCVLGPSGSGKSSLLQVIGAVRRPTGGRVVVAGIDLGQARRKTLAGLRASVVGFALQGAARNLVPYGTVRQNVLAAAYYGRGRLHGDAAVQDELRVLGLGDVLDRDCSLLSGGQRQRVALACALASRPRVLLADEPTSQLSHEDRDVVVRLLHEVSQRWGTTLVVVTHDPQVATSFPRRVTMRDGLVVEDVIA